MFRIVGQHNLVVSRAHRLLVPPELVESAVRVAFVEHAKVEPDAVIVALPATAKDADSFPHPDAR